MSLYIYIHENRLHKTIRILRVYKIYFQTKNTFCTLCKKSTQVYIYIY